MDRLIWTLFIFLIACADVPVRHPATVSNALYGDVDHSYSVVKTFPKDQEQDGEQSFYLELRNKEKQFIDVNFEQIIVKSPAANLNFSLQRLGRGRYEIKINQEDLEFKNLRFEVQNKEIKHSLNRLSRPSKKHSQLKIIANPEYNLWLELNLRDLKGHPLDLSYLPEVIVEGEAVMSDIRQTKKGTWHIQMTYSEGNQILYFSVRANGVKLERLLRFQHVEK
jgi:hypothetical protein